MFDFSAYGTDGCFSHDDMMVSGKEFESVVCGQHDDNCGYYNKSAENYPFSEFQFHFNVFTGHEKSREVEEFVYPYEAQNGDETYGLDYHDTLEEFV